MNLDTLLLECTLQMQMSLDLNSSVHIFEYLCLLGFHTAVASLYHSAPRGMSRGFLEKQTHTKVNHSGLRTRGLEHTIHYHLETTANASTKAKLKVEPFNSLVSSLFLHRSQTVLVLKSSRFCCFFFPIPRFDEIHMHSHASPSSRFSLLYLDQIWRQRGASVLSQAARLHGSCSLTALIRRLVKISGLSGKRGCGCGCGHPPSRHPLGAGTDPNSNISTAAAPRLHIFADRDTDRFGDESPLFTLSTARKYA